MIAKSEAERAGFPQALEGDMARCGQCHRVTMNSSVNPHHHESACSHHPQNIRRTQIGLPYHVLDKRNLDEALIRFENPTGRKQVMVNSPFDGAIQATTQARDKQLHLSGSDAEMIYPTTCQRCRQKKANVVFVPCGCVCYCTSCFDAIRHQDFGKQLMCRGATSKKLIGCGESVTGIVYSEPFTMGHVTKLKSIN